MNIDIDAITARLRESRRSVDEALDALASIGAGSSESAAVASVIERLATELTARMPIQFHADIDVWSSKEVAAYLKVNPKQVLERYAPLSSFPDPIRLPNGSGGHGHPRWHARDIIIWVEQYKGK